MSAGAIRRSWGPVARSVLRYSERGATPSMRQMTTASSTIMRSVPVEWISRGVGLPWSQVAAAGGTRFSSAWRSAANVPHVRRASNAGALREYKDGEETKGSGEPNGEMHDQKRQMVRSNYWGITPKSNFREDGTPWPWNCFKPGDAYSPNVGIDLTKHHAPENWEDRLAFWTVKALRWPTDLFFRKRYGCRAMMLETVAAVPGMVAGMTLHLRSIRRFEHSGGWIKALLEEAENERMHLMTFMEVAKPNWYERALVVVTQGVFFNAYFLFYLLAPRVAHRFTGYLEEEAIYSYTHFLEELDKGNIENVPAPAIAIDYWRLPKDATLRDVVVVVRADEAHHRDVNHYASNIRKEGKQLNQAPAPVEYH